MCAGEQGDQLVFEVIDTGIGIAEEMQSRIFERFRQADLDSSLVNDGCGLGLTISKAYIEIMKGKIWVQSNPGKGSVFSFSIPYENAKVEELNLNKKLNQADESYKKQQFL